MSRLKRITTIFRSKEKQNFKRLKVDLAPKVTFYRFGVYILMFDAFVSAIFLSGKILPECAKRGPEAVDGAQFCPHADFYPKKNLIPCLMWSETV